MKVFIIFIGIILLSFGFFVYQTDMDNMIIDSIHVKEDATNLAHSIALFFDTEQFGEGFMVIDDTEMIKAYNDWSTENNYDQVEISIFDESGFRRYYKDGSLEAKEAFTFPVEYEDSSGYKTTVSKPTVLVTLRQGGSYFRLFDDDLEEIVRTSSYAINPWGL